MKYSNFDLTAMATRIKGAVGPVKGASYEKRGHVPIATRPCEHVALFKDKNPLRGGGTRIVTFHGDSDGVAGAASRGV